MVLAEVAPRRAVWLSEWAGPLAAVLILVIVALECAFLGIDQAKTHFREDGLVEESSPVVLALTCLLYLVWKGRIGARSLVPALMLFIMALRELDADKWLTNKSLFSTGYYFDNPGVGYGQRILVGVIVGGIGIAILRLLWESRLRIWHALRAFQPYGRSLLLGFVLLGASQLLDGAGRTYLWLVGSSMPHAYHALAGIFEETTELAAYVVFLVALLQLRFDTAHNALPTAGAALA